MFNQPVKKQNEILIELYERYNLKSEFLEYCYNISTQKYGGRGGCTDSLEAIAFTALSYFAEGKIKKPTYNLSPEDGPHPLSSCEPECKHYSYTQKPVEDKVIKLEKLLNNKKLIIEAIKLEKHLNKHPIKIIVG